MLICEGRERKGDATAGDAIRDELAAALGPTARLQLLAYWPEYVRDDPLRSAKVGAPNARESAHARSRASGAPQTAQEPQPQAPSPKPQALRPTPYALRPTP